MTSEEKIESLRHLLREAPDVLSPLQIARWTHQSKNTVYALIKSCRLTAYAYHGGFLVAKADLIEYMADTTDDNRRQAVPMSETRQQDFFDEIHSIKHCGFETGGNRLFYNRSILQQIFLFRPSKCKSGKYSVLYS